MIKIRDLSFRYDSMNKNIFENFSLNIDQSWKLGLIGRNGRGKTTFFNLLLNNYQHKGIIKSSIRFSYFPQKVSNNQMNTKNVLLNLASINEESLWKIEVEMNKLQLESYILDRPFNTLSPGEQTKALLAALFVDKNVFKLIDEPTNHLDINGRKTVQNYLKSKIGFIVVSHDKNFINKIIDHILSIDRAKIQLFNGNFETWKKNFDTENNKEINKKKKLKSDVRKLKVTAHRIKQWGNNSERKKNGKSYHGQKNVDLDKGFIGHKSAKIMKRNRHNLNNIENKIIEKKSLLLNVDEMPNLDLNYTPPKQKNLLKINKLQVMQNKKILNKPLTLELKCGERIILSGPNGTGKTTIINSIMGKNNLIANGKVNLNQSLRISYLKQNIDNVQGSLKDYANINKIHLSTLLNMLKKMGFERSEFNKNINNMSMGQKRKINIARSLCENANIYFWDEPLNYLDIITREQIKNIILKKKPTMIIIDHDIKFINSIKTNVIKIIQN